MVNERNHLSDVGISHKVNIIGKGTVDLPMLQILQPDGSVHDDADMPDLSRDEALKIFRTMHYIRVLDERMVGAQRQGRISFYLACSGEEASTIGSAAALSENDMIMSQYREQGALAYRGYRTEQFMNQMFSNKLDPNKGRQMPIHYGDKAQIGRASCRERV